LARHQEAEAKEEREAAKAAKTQDKAKTGDDQESRKIVESINVSIKIVGCGGVGRNTVNRCSEAGITAPSSVPEHGCEAPSVRARSEENPDRQAPHEGLGAAPSPKVGSKPPTKTRKRSASSSGSHVVFINAALRLFTPSTCYTTSMTSTPLRIPRKRFYDGVVTIHSSREAEFRWRTPSGG